MQATGTAPPVYRIAVGGLLGEDAVKAATDVERQFITEGLFSDKKKLGQLLHLKPVSGEERCAVVRTKAHGAMFAGKVTHKPASGTLFSLSKTANGRASKVVDKSSQLLTDGEFATVIVLGVHGARLRGDTGTADALVRFINLAWQQDGSFTGCMVEPIDENGVSWGIILT